MAPTTEESGKPNALIIGSNGTIGAALVEQLALSHRVATLSRQQTDYSEPDLQAQFNELSTRGRFDRR